MKRTSLALLLCVIGLGCSGPKDAPPQQALELHGQKFKVQTVASNLYVPWSLAWLPDGRMLITERNGRLNVMGPDGQVKLLHKFDEVDTGGEHGLMGMALSPQFATDHWLYLSYTGRIDGKDGLRNIIARWRLVGDGVSGKQVLLDSLPAGDYHDGLPLHFGPDGKLYASTGDATHGDLAQLKSSLAGKFLRMNPDGTVPDDNPLPHSLIWTLGNRNCQGFDWQPSTGRLYATEHGPTAPLDSLVGGGDELNLIEKGRNYGWPKYHHDMNAEGFVAPLQTWTPAIAPSGAAFYHGDKFPAWNNRFFFAALRGEALYCVTFSAADPGKIDNVSRVLHQQFGRMRAVAVGPDGLLYLTTSNRDKRGQLREGDDKVLRLVPQ